MITLAEAKLHLRVDSNGEDTAIQVMIDAATAAAEDYLNMNAGSLATDAPAPVKSATLLMVGDLYENRERQSAEPYYVNKTWSLLLNPYRTMEA